MHDQQASKGWSYRWMDGRMNTVLDDNSLQANRTYVNCYSISVIFSNKQSNHMLSSLFHNRYIMYINLKLQHYCSDNSIQTKHWFIYNRFIHGRDRSVLYRLQKRASYFTQLRWSVFIQQTLSLTKKQYFTLLQQTLNAAKPQIIICLIFIWCTLLYKIIHSIMKCEQQKQFKPKVIKDKYTIWYLNSQKII